MPLSFDAAVLESIDAVVQVVEVRRVLEGEIAALAAERATRAQVAALRRALKAIDAARAEGGDGVAEDLAFHRAIGDATGNPQFGRLLELSRAVPARGDARHARQRGAPRRLHGGTCGPSTARSSMRSRQGSRAWRGGAPSSTCGAAIAGCRSPA